MNLFAITSGAIAVVNPMTPALLQISTGNVQAADFTRSPTYRAAVTVMAQVQDLSSEDIQHLEGLNLQGSEVAIYLSGDLDGLVRAENKGGDLVTIGAGTRAGDYLVTTVLEQWPDWVKVAATLQNT